jgi:hypothetical protein
MSSPTPYLAVLLRPGAPVASRVVRADAWRDDAGMTRLFRDEALVFSAPTASIVAIEPHPDHRAATLAVWRHRMRRVGGSTLHVHEAQPAPARRARADDHAVTTRARGAPAEGVSVRIEE